MTHDSPEFDAALAVTELEKSKADGIKSLIAAVKLAATYQQRAEKAEAALGWIKKLAREWDLTEFPDERTADMMRLDLGQILATTKPTS